MKRPGWAAIACAIAGLAAVAPAEVAGQPAAFVHVRCTDGRTLDLLQEGSRRSATFKRLVEDLEGSDVIVYVESAAHFGVPVSAHLQMAGATPAARYLRIRVKIPAGADNAIALLGHELQHAREVAHAAAVRDQRALEALYRAIGERMDVGWETLAARRIASIIRDELRREVRPVDLTPTPATGPAIPPKR